MPAKNRSKGDVKRLVRPQKSLQVKTTLGIEVTEFSGDRAGVARHATAMVTIGLRRVMQIFGAGSDSIPRDIEGVHRAGMQTGLRAAVEAG